MSLMITSYGRELISNSFITSKPINLKYIGVGSGLNETRPTFDTLDVNLKNRVYYGTISNYTKVINNNDNTITLSMNIVIPYTSGGYTIREIALYAEKIVNNISTIDDKAFALSSIFDTYKPTLDQSGNKINLTVKCSLKLSSNINITVSTSGDFDLIEQKISDTVDRKISEYFRENPIYNLPKDGNFGNVLLKTGSEPYEYMWLPNGMMISDIIRSDENENKFIN